MPLCVTCAWPVHKPERCTGKSLDEKGRASKKAFCGVCLKVVQQTGLLMKPGVPLYHVKSQTACWDAFEKARFTDRAREDGWITKPLFRGEKCSSST